MKSLVFAASVRLLAIALAPAATQIAAVSHQPVPTTEATNESEYKSAEVTTTQPPAQEQQQEQRTEIAQNTPPPAPEAAPAPAPEAAPAPQELPKTGSPYPLI